MEFVVVFVQVNSLDIQNVSKRGKMYYYWLHMIIENVIIPVFIDKFALM